MHGSLGTESELVVITGGLGFLGTRLAEDLRSRGKKVVVLDNRANPSPLSDQLTADRGYCVIDCDICDHEAVERVRRDLAEEISAIYHLACLASPALYSAEPIHTLRTSSQGTMNIVELAARGPTKLIFTSTSEVYGDPLEHPQSESYFGNVNPTSPRSVYDEGKRFAEALISAAHREWGVDIRIARLFNSYGPGMALDDGRLIPNILTSILRGNAIPVYGSGQQTRSLCFVDDTIRGITALADSRETTPVNIGRDDERSVREICEIASEIAEVECQMDFHPLPIGDPKQRRPDLNKAREAIGWSPRVSLEEGLRRTLEYFRTIVIDRTS